ncbi:MAG: ATP-binding protein [Myxococcota bacterium]
MEGPEVRERFALIVEDSEDDVVLLRRALGALEGAELTISVAYSLDAARAMLADRRFDVIFLDYRIGPEDAIELLRELRRAKRNDPVVALTGRSDEYVAADLVRAGADHYVAKRDIHGEVLRRAVTSVLSLGTLREAEELAAHAEELEVANRELSAFAGVMSHDLQAPLRTVEYFIGSALECLGDKAPPRVAKSLCEALLAVSRMGGLCADLLAFCRAGSRGRPSLPVDLGEVVSEVVENLWGAIEESHANVEFESLPVLFGDRARLVQLFQNLIGNALKFRGEASPRIRIVARQANAMREIRVEDNGRGIDPEDAERVFEIFQRGSAAESVPGSGVGLATCRQIAAQHGGWIRVEPRGAPGTTICIGLPAADGVLAEPVAQPLEAEPVSRRSTSAAAEVARRA